MKKFSFLALAAAGLLFGACSDKDEATQNLGGKTAVDDAFIGISIQLPSADGTTRANEDYDDGEDDEFAVKDATLYIFKGSSEATATYVASYAMGTSFVNDEGVNVTSTYSNATQIDGKLAEEINSSASTVNYYAYIVVNNNGQIGSLDESVTFADFSDNEFNSIGDSPVAAEKNIGDGGLLMTNAPVCAENGGNEAAPTAVAKYNTLVVIDKTKIFSTADAAKAAPAACVYVERAAVKISVINNVASTASINSKSVTVSGWQIINYEPTFYNTRHIDPAWGALATDADDAAFSLYASVKATNQYRFVSYRDFKPMLNQAHSDEQPYRTFFAKDPHYNVDVTTTTTTGTETVTTSKLLRPAADVNGAWINPGKHGYTTENTFDVERQKWQNTTMVTLRVAFNDGDAFYMITGDDLFYDAAGAKTKLAANIANTTIAKNALKTACEILAGTTTDVYTATLTVNFTAPTVGTTGLNYTVSFAISSTTGTKTQADLTSAQAEAVQDALDDCIAAYKLSYYADGMAYYNIRIKHFGEYETPWSSTAPFQTIAPGTTVQQIYGVGQNDKYNDRFLGRYGVVRDNWYRISVDDIKKVGSAEPVSVTGTGKDTPDDEIENFISVHVHILPWVLRNQSVNL